MPAVVASAASSVKSTATTTLSRSASTGATPVSTMAMLTPAPVNPFPHTAGTSSWAASADSEPGDSAATTGVAGPLSR